MTLTIEEQQSPVWGRVKEQLEERVAVLQKELERMADHDRTNMIRGGLRELRGILIAGEEVPVQEPDLTQSF